MCVFIRDRKDISERHFAMNHELATRKKARKWTLCGKKQKISLSAVEATTREYLVSKQES